MTDKQTAVKNSDTNQPDGQGLNLAEKTEAVVVLDGPIVRGNISINEITVRKPQSGTLRGVRLHALMDMDVDSMMLVLPRITSPALTKQDLLVMEPGDLFNLGIEVVNFLLPKSVRSASQIV